MISIALPVGLVAGLLQRMKHQGYGSIALALPVWMQNVRKGGSWGEAPELKVVGVGCDVGQEEGVGDRFDHVARLPLTLIVVPQHPSGLGACVVAAGANDHPVHRQPCLHPVFVQELWKPLFIPAEIYSITTSDHASRLVLRGYFQCSSMGLK